MDLNQHKNLHECHWLSGRGAQVPKDIGQPYFMAELGYKGSGVMIDSGT